MSSNTLPVGKTQTDRSPETNGGKKNKRLKKFFGILLMVLVVGILGVVVVGDWLLPKERERKRDKEIDGIRSKPRPRESCEVYALVSRKTGTYPCYNCENHRTIILNRGEVWKYGKTCVGKDERYTEQYLDELNLDFVSLFHGNETDCLVKEKELIYAYPSLPECQKRNFSLKRPPGNKIDR